MDQVHGKCEQSDFCVREVLPFRMLDSDGLFSFSVHLYVLLYFTFRFSAKDSANEDFADLMLGSCSVSQGSIFSIIAFGL